MKQEQSNKLLLIDGHSILNRAFYGVPDLTNAEGIHTNALYGFLNIMFRFIDEEKPDYIILDPPRDGIHPKAIGKIIDYGVENMVYISCKPSSLARDLEIFAARGYEVKKICCVDMFPNTYHIETVVGLHRKDM